MGEGVARSVAVGVGVAVISASKVGVNAVAVGVGVGMISSYGVAGKIFKVLSDQKINIEMISTSEIGISCVIDDIYAELAQKVIHKAFIEGEEQ